MVEPFIDVLCLGMWQTNCYVVGDRTTGHCAIIDPGQGGSEALPALVEEKGYHVEALLLTHGHLDHTWSAPDLARLWPTVPIRLHKADTWMWEDPTAGMGTPKETLMQLGLAWDISGLGDQLETYTDRSTMTLAGIAFTVMHTPGHTPGSSVFIADALGEEGVVFAGDLIFKGSIGRTDLPGGDDAQMQQSLRLMMQTQPDDRIIAPGHGEVTSMGQERRINPFLRQYASSPRLR
ncbi:MBL fold metallo-hydrolase [Stomatohabitans albus]|uniref:MBL fold metallo-hydrolase n=1 Tax=Stomatohabitans albus TaxID=3110766 RepID=UPI00300C7D87